MQRRLFVRSHSRRVNQTLPEKPSAVLIDSAAVDILAENNSTVRHARASWRHGRWRLVTVRVSSRRLDRVRLQPGWSFDR